MYQIYMHHTSYTIIHLHNKHMKFAVFVTSSCSQPIILLVEYSLSHVSSAATELLSTQENNSELK